MWKVYLTTGGSSKIARNQTLEGNKYAVSRSEEGSWRVATAILKNNLLNVIFFIL
jgi:hypothetical protein